jgi:regulator of CtrA degradation
MAVFFSRTYDEAFDLLLEARDYLACRAPIDREQAAFDQRIVQNCEAFRLTSRLTQVMAWLLVRKAVDAGELTEIEAEREEHRLAGQSVCLAQPEASETMPAGLRSLLERSYLLYARIERLDAQVAHQSQDAARRRQTGRAY